ncbi:preprotein translocase subunit SecG [Desulfovibrio litoralis]|uniref:Protein-export membrane protein SecG n=1 Tax=Desulfovibrio litoralis DSM 11393 TaxID=1121455 RepID=A0A1M7S195_9BACT|nr:preprotein translocase subunit SecG [Desulfovibrio litoralis]SHN52124.1 preprotein translocase subunit SecG [Desulfovibrio litoralis DSM 11393]
MQTLVLTLHIIVCILLVILVLLQSGKEGMGVIFGGGSGSVFGSSGAGGILVKLTAFTALIFLCTSLAYNIIISKPKNKSILDTVIPIEEVNKPVQTNQTTPSN